MKLKSYFNPTTGVVQVRLAADAAPAAPFVLLGDVTHEVNDNMSGMQRRSINHVIFQHVQEQLYLKHAVQDMQRISITTGGAFKLLESFSVDTGVTSIKPGEKITLKLNVFPTDASIDGFYVVATDPALVNIALKGGTTNTYEVTIPADADTILRVGIMNSGLEYLIPVEARAIERQA